MNLKSVLSSKRWAYGLLGLVAVIAAQGRLTAGSAVQALPEHVPGELIVKATGDTGFVALSHSLQSALSDIGVLAIEPLLTDERIHKVTIADANQIQEAIQTLTSLEGVQYAEPNFIYRTLSEPNDPRLGDLWGLINRGQTVGGQSGTQGADINVAPLWAQGMTGSRDIVVAVIDTGIDGTHPDLVDNMYRNPREIPGNGVDDDGNGFIDDVSGWNFESGRGNNNAADDHNHGTHCAGTIGAKGNNALGVVGVNWNVSLMPIKFLGASGGGSLEGAINAINYATRMGVQVMSNSWGGGGFSQTLRDAIQASSEAGIVFVAAAGNSYADNDSRPSYPASYDIPNVISVAATDNRDRKADFSNFGRRSVHVAAPGKDVVSTVRNAGYASYSGTSMACPHVAGIAALMLSRNPNMGFAELKERLIKTSTPVSALKRQVLAKGRVNAYNAVFNVIPPSDEPDDSLWVPMEYTLESSHPLADNLDQVFEVAAPGARYMRVVFERIETEERYDTVAIESASGEAVDIYSGTFQNLTSEYVAGSSLRIRVRTDGSVPSWGFKVARLEVIR